MRCPARVHLAQQLTVSLAAMAVLGGTATAAAAVVPTRPNLVRAHASAARASSMRGLVLSPFEARLLVLLNQARVSNGLRRLTAVPGATDVARRWSVQLAGDGALSHNPRMIVALQNAGSSAWLHVAENVGRAPAGQADALFAAYLLSPHHRHNIMNPAMRFVGIGVIEVAGVNGAAGEVWNTMDFTDAYNARYGRSRTSVVGPVATDALPRIADGWKSRARRAG